MFESTKRYDASDLILTEADTVDERYPFLNVCSLKEAEPLVTIKITAEFDLKMHWSKNIGSFDANAVERICLAALEHRDRVRHDALNYL